MPWVQLLQGGGVQIQRKNYKMTSLDLSKLKNCPIWELWKEPKEIEFSNMCLNFLVHIWINYEFLKFQSIWKLDNLEPKIVKKCQMGQLLTFQENSKKFNFSTCFRIFWFNFEFILNFWNCPEFEKLTISSLKLSKRAKCAHLGALTRIQRNSILDMFLNFLVNFWINYDFLKFQSIWNIENLKPKITKKCQMCQFGSFDKNS